MSAFAASTSALMENSKPNQIRPGEIVRAGPQYNPVTSSDGFFFAGGWPAVGVVTTCGG
jgi:hypothetical protein